MGARACSPRDLNLATTAVAGVALPPPPEPCAWAYKESGKLGEGRSYQGRVTSGLSPASWGRLSLFFGGSGPCSSRGVFPFFAAENLLIGAMGATTRRRGKEEEEGASDGKKEMSKGGSAPLLIYSQEEANRRPP